MSNTANIHLVLENFIWRLEKFCTPLIRSDVLFRYIDPLSVEDRPQNTGGFRRFTALFLGSSEQLGVMSGSDRWSEVNFKVVVGYPIVLGSYRNIIEYMSKDRHMITRTLMNDVYRIGYDSTHTTDDIGLGLRKRTSDEILSEDENGNEETMLLSLNFNCNIYETEY